MTIPERILAALRRTDRVCDDCLSEVTGVKPRQSINMANRAMALEKRVSRPVDACSRCRRVKTVNCLGAAADQAVVARPTPAPQSERPWYWEGNVQRRIVDFLRASDYIVLSEADTASRQQGKDIVARSPEGQTLWVTVKGFPEKSANAQARHWFQNAFHDVARYRDEDASALLGMGLPGGFSTYEGLVKRDVTVRRHLGYRVYWVHQDGRVVIEDPT